MLRKTYGHLRSLLGDRHKDLLTRVIFDLGITPTVKDNKGKRDFPDNSQGGLIISADFEMAWAFRYSKRKVNPFKMAALEREHVPLMLSMFDRYSVPITWATVGHLFLESCTKGDHDWMRRIPHFDDHWCFTEGDWYDHDPYTNFQSNNAWYAPDLIELVLKAKTRHEIGCHTFSHIDCSYKNCPPDVLDDELIACSQVAKKWGLELKTLVFPGGTAGNYEVLRKHGYQMYRKNTDFDLSYPYRDEFGMLTTTSTGSFGRNANWSQEYYISRFCKIIDKAIMTNTIAHFWLHPSVDRWTLDNVMPAVMHYAAQKREAGELWIGTMKDIVDFMEGDAS